MKSARADRKRDRNEHASATVYVQIAATAEAVQANLASVRLLLEVHGGHVLLLMGALPKASAAALALKRSPGPLVYVADVGLQLATMRKALAALFARVRCSRLLLEAKAHMSKTATKKWIR